MMFLGHVSLWFFILILMLIIGVVRYKGSPATLLVGLIIFSTILAIPSCILHAVFFK